MYKIPRIVTLGGQGMTKSIAIGGKNPITVQTMWKEGIIGVKNDSNALSSILDDIEILQSVGCDILRFAVPDMESAESLCTIAQNTSMPLVADIHFDYRLALKCLEGNVAAIRINPGNIGSRENTEKVVNACRDKGVSIRIGVNTGSLPQDLREQVEKGKMSRAVALSETAMRECAVFDELNFDQFVVSMKASSVKETIEANEAFACKSDAPLHIGVTEAGPIISGVVKSTLAFSHLLDENIGSTIRVSLSDSPLNEVIAGREILRQCGKREHGVELVSCPRCGRQGFDVHNFVKRWQTELLSLDKDITVAVMGCVVNGPGEGKHADLGICGAGDYVLIFKKGQIVYRLEADKSITDENLRLKKLSEDADNCFRKELLSL